MVISERQKKAFGGVVLAAGVFLLGVAWTLYDEARQYAAEAAVDLQRAEAARADAEQQLTEAKSALTEARKEHEEAARKLRLATGLGSSLALPQSTLGSANSAPTGGPAFAVPQSYTPGLVMPPALPTFGGYDPYDDQLRRLQDEQEQFRRWDEETERAKHSPVNEWLRMKAEDSSRNTFNW